MEELIPLYAVVETGGKQYRVGLGEVLDVERLKAAAGDEIVFERVLGIGGNGDFVVGTPTVPGARVIAKVLAQARGRKVIVFRYKAKVNYRRKTGHRQALTRVRITDIRTAVAAAAGDSAGAPEA